MSFTDSGVTYKGSTKMIKNFTTKRTTSWKPTKAGTYVINAYVKDSKKTVKKSVKYVVNSAIKVSNFQASVDSEDAYVGLNISLSSKAIGGSKKYSYKYVYTFNKETVVISDFSSAKKISWKPTEAGKYKLGVYIMDTNSQIIVGKTIKNYIVRKDNSLAIDYFTVNRKSGQKVGKQLKFNADILGGAGNVKYRFSYDYDGNTTIIADYSSKSVVKFTPDKAGVYKFTVTAKDSKGNLATSNKYFFVR